MRDLLQNLYTKYHSVIYEKGERWIILWALQNKENRLYKFPWTEENEDSLDQAKRNQEQFGIPQMGEVIPKKKVIEISVLEIMSLL